MHAHVLASALLCTHAHLRVRAPIFHRAGETKTGLGLGLGLPARTAAEGPGCRKALSQREGCKAGVIFCHLRLIIMMAS